MFLSYNFGADAYKVKALSFILAFHIAYFILNKYVINPAREIKLRNSHQMFWDSKLKGIRYISWKSRFYTSFFLVLKDE